MEMILSAAAIFIFILRITNMMLVTTVLLVIFFGRIICPIIAKILLNILSELELVIVGFSVLLKLCAMHKLCSYWIKFSC